VFSQAFHSVEDWVRLLKRMVDSIGADVRSGICEIFPNETRKGSRPHAIRAPGTWNPKTNQLGAIFFTSAAPLFQKKGKKEVSSFLYHSTDGANASQLNDSGSRSLYCGGYQNWLEQFAITQPNTRHGQLCALVYCIFRQVSHGVARANADAQYRAARVQPKATLAEHLENLNNSGTGMTTQWNAELSDVEQKMLSKLECKSKRDLFRILQNFARHAAAKRETDFPFPIQHVARRLAVSFQYVSKLLIVAIASEIWLPFISTASAAEPKRVLIVHSFGSAAPPFTVHSTAFETALVKEMGGQVDLDEISLDMARYPDSDIQEAIADYLEKRHAKWQPDLVVPIGGPAAIFVATYRDRLFPNTPILYASVDRRLLPEDALKNNAAFVGMIFDIPGLMEDALRVAPETKNIAVVVGASVLEKYWKEAYQKIAEPLAPGINFIYFDDLSFNQMLQRAATLPPHSYIFFDMVLRDAAGVTYNSDKALQRLHAVANAPINGVFDHQMGLGIVGGRLYPSEYAGGEAAQMAIRILRGQPASSLPPRLIERLPPRYDWRELQRWKIDEKLLPPGNTILYRTPSLWEQHRALIIAGISICVLQALLIAGLVANLIRRRRAEGSLVESEGRFQVMANAAPVLIWMSGVDKLCTFFNKPWLEFTGRNMEQELGNGWTDGVHADDLQKCFKTYTEAFDARQPFVMQYRLRRNDGEYRWVSDQGVARYDAQGEFAGYVGSCVDVTELVNKDVALRESEERMRLAADAANLGIWECDLSKDEIWATNARRALLGWPASGKITLEDFISTVHPDDHNRIRQAIDDAIHKGRDFDSEYRLVLPDGIVRWMAARGSVHFDAHGNPARLLGISIDITARKQAELEAKQRRDELSHLSRVALVGELSTSIAHELNQPLAGILTNAGAGECIIDQGDVDLKEIRQLLADISVDASRASDVVRGIRGMIKKEQVTRRRIDLNDVVTNVVHIIGSDALLHGCELKTSLEAALPTVEVDPVQIEQVLINLIVNAFDAMRDTPVSKRRVEIMTQRSGDGAVCISVRDYGLGISEEMRSRIFEQFFTTKPEGLGMGLAIVRSIIEDHAGTIEAENAEGEGARFHFTLPTSAGG
jgi:PAS domain S-box-containing protein